VIERSVRAGDDFMTILTPRERQVLGMTATGLTNREIANGLEISIHAVKFHLAMIYKKLGVGNRTEATYLYFSSRTAS
jgi:DNA-binding CsgD family transcriptional regulator